MPKFFSRKFLILYAIIPFLMFNTISSYGETPSPLEQTKQGIPANEVSCKKGLVLMVRESGDPACLTPSSYMRSIDRGWGVGDLDLLQKHPEQLDSIKATSLLGYNLSNSFLFENDVEIFWVDGSYISILKTNLSTQDFAIVSNLINYEEKQYSRLDPKFKMEKIFETEQLITGLDILENNDILILDRWGGVFLFNINSKNVTKILEISDVGDRTIEGYNETGAFDIISKSGTIENFYVTYTSGPGDSLKFILKNYQWNNKTNIYDEIIIFETKGEQHHNGGKMLIDNNILYLTVGEHAFSRTYPEVPCPVTGTLWCESVGYPFGFSKSSSIPNAQNQENPFGKILRLNLDGSIPNDNPIFNSPIFVYGIRNSFGMEKISNGTLIFSDNGPDRSDEINILNAGGNYGWPFYYGIEENHLPSNVQKTVNERDVIWPIVSFSPSRGITALVHDNDNKILIGFNNESKLMMFSYDTTCGEKICFNGIWTIAFNFHPIIDIEKYEDGFVLTSFNSIYRISKNFS